MRLTRTFNAGHDNLYLNKDDVNRLLKGQMLKESSLIVQMENPEREWVGLKDEEIYQGLLRSPYALQNAGAWREGVTWAEEILKRKNYE